MKSFTFRNVSEALPVLCKEVLINGDEVGSRNGRTMELPFTHITLTHPWERYITVPGRRASLPAQVAEVMWVLAGRNDIEWLSHYLPRAAEFSDDGETWRGGYGPRLRAWLRSDEGGEPYDDLPVDQLKHVVELLKKEPLTRRAVMAIYNPHIDSYPGKDVPCNDFIQFMSRLGKLDMHVFIRSNDLMWGWSGINAFEWSALQEIVSRLIGVEPGQLHFSISSLHLYDRHWKKAEELSRAWDTPIKPGVPRFKPYEKSVMELDRLVEEWFHIEELIRSGESFERHLQAFPEPMLQSWLVVIAKYHDPEFFWDELLPDDMAATLSQSPKKPEHVQTVQPATDWSTMTPFVAYVDNLHREKTKAYGDSWKRRGEMLGIMANIARKIDRLGTDGAGDSATDTAVDLMVYLIKMRIWLAEHLGHGLAWLPDTVTPDSEDLDQFTAYLVAVSEKPRLVLETEKLLEQDLVSMFEILEHKVEEKRVDRWEVVDSMIESAYRLANKMWWKDQNATRAFTGYPS